MAYGKSYASGSRSPSKAKKRSGGTRTRRARKRKRSSGSSQSRSGARSKKKRAKARAPRRTYARYDPESFVLARVANTDPRYDEWLTAAQMRSAKKARAREREKRTEGGLKIAEGLAPALLPAAQSTVAAAQRAADTARKSVARVAAARVAVGAGSAATVGVGAAAGLAILAGVASYYGTTWLMERIRKLTDPQERAATLATAYRTARREAAKRLGRELTPEENKYLGAELQAQIAKMGGRVQ